LSAEKPLLEKLPFLKKSENLAEQTAVMILERGGLIIKLAIRLISLTAASLSQLPAAALIVTPSRLLAFLKPTAR